MEQPLAGHQSSCPADSAGLVTTRVLTDEKGHSIKIRLASPPPRRQRQLADQFERQPAPVCALSPAWQEGREAPEAGRPALGNWPTQAGGQQDRQSAGRLQAG